MVEGGMKCVKYLLFLFNLIFVIAGIGLIAAGAYVTVQFNGYYNFLGNTYAGPGILLIIVGVIIFLLAFFGCCGAVKENYCLTMTFAVSLAVIFILEIAGGIAGFVLRSKIETEIEKVLRDNLGKYYSDHSMEESWDKLQKEFKCCGVNGSANWQGVPPNYTVPLSCCEDENQCSTRPAAYFKQGCASKLESWLQDKVVIVGGVGIGLAFVQVIGIVFACCLARAIKKEYEVV